ARIYAPRDGSDADRDPRRARERDVARKMRGENAQRLAHPHAEREAADREHRRAQPRAARERGEEKERGGRGRERAIGGEEQGRDEGRYSRDGSAPAPVRRLEKWNSGAPDTIRT